MDKFNDFMRNKIIEENENFSLPKSFEDKIESVLDDIDNKESIKIDPWYKNRRILTMAACFAFSCFVLMKLLVNKGDMIDSAPKTASQIETAEDSAYGLYSEEGAEVREQILEDSLPEIGSNITLALISENNEIRDIKGDVVDYNKESSYSRVENSEMDNNLKILVLDKNENIDIAFSQVPTFYKVNLLKDNSEDINNNINLEEYFSENFILEAPSEAGIYLFEIIGYWEGEEIKYTVKIRVK